MVGAVYSEAPEVLLLPRRMEGWEARLYAAIDAARDRPFEWGQHDCALFAAAVVEQLIGVDVAAPWRGYSTELEAQRIVDGAGGLVELVSQSLLSMPIQPPFARRGDVVMIPSQRIGWDGALGVCEGARGVFASPHGGLSFAPISLAVRAWRIR